MIDILVSIPPKFHLNDDEMHSYALHVENIAIKAMVKLDKYAVILNRVCFDWLATVNASTEECSKGYVVECIRTLCDVDYAVFANGWKSSNECNIIHSVALALDVPVLDLDDSEAGEYT